METTSAPGVVFTPKRLADRLFDGLPRPPREPVRVLDPACGEGALLEAAVRRLGPSVELLGLELDAGRAARARRALAEASVERGDALDPDRAWPACDLIVANPPWVSCSGRRAFALTARQRERYATWPSFRGWPSLHGPFLERIARHVEQCRARARVLVPLPVCDLERYRAVREAVTRHARLEAPPLPLAPGAFEGVTEPAVMLSLARRRGSGPGSTEPWFPLEGADAALVEHLAAFPKLPPEAFGDPGVHTGNSAAELLVRDGSDAGEPLREGRDVRPFAVDPPRLRLRTDLERTAARRFRFGPRDLYEAVPVVVRQTADRPIAAAHARPTYFRNSLLACTPPEDLDPAFVVAVLNGPVAAAWHRALFRDSRQRAFPQVKVGHLRTQPFPIRRRDDDPRLHDALAELARRLTRAPEGTLEARLADETLAAFDLSADLAAHAWAIAGLGRSGTEP